MFCNIGEELGHPYALDAIKGRLFWIDRNASSIRSRDRNGNLSLVRETLTKLVGIKVNRDLYFFIHMH